MVSSSSNSGMPSLVIEQEGKEYPIAYGYTSFGEVKNRVKQFI